MPEIPADATLAWAWPILLTVIAVIVTAIVNQPQWSAARKQTVTAVVAGLVGFVYALATGYIPGVPPDVVAIVVQWLIVAATIIVFGKAAFEFFKTPITWLENKTALPQSQAQDAPDEPTDDAQDETTEGVDGLPADTKTETVQEE